MDAWAWSDHLAPWLAARVELPIGAPVLRDRRADARAAVVSDRLGSELRRYAVAADGRRRFARISSVMLTRSSSLGRGAAAGDPAAARAFLRLDHERVSTGDRCRGDHRHDPCAARADDARQRWARALRPGRAGQAGGSAARRNRPLARGDSAASRDCGSKARAVGVVGGCSNASTRHIRGRAAAPARSNGLPVEPSSPLAEAAAVRFRARTDGRQVYESHTPHAQSRRRRCSPTRLPQPRDGEARQLASLELPASSEAGRDSVRSRWPAARGLQTKSNS